MSTLVTRLTQWHDGVMPTTRFTQEVAGILRAELGRSQHSQAWLGELLGMSQSQMSKTLRGLKPIDLDQLAIACTLFGRTMLDVITEAEQRSRDNSV